jgi:hypothetical protein
LNILVNNFYTYEASGGKKNINCCPHAEIRAPLGGALCPKVKDEAFVRHGNEIKYYLLQIPVLL